MCGYDGKGGQNCVELSNGQYDALYAAQNGQQGIGLPKGQGYDTNGAITCGGVVCGSVTGYEVGGGMGRETADLAVGIGVGKMTEPLFAWTGRWIGGMFSRTLGEASGALSKAANALAELRRPAWAETPGGFVNWLKNLQRAGTKLTADQADALVSEAKRLNVDVRLDPPHPGTNWDRPHLNIGKEGQVHLEVPEGYDHPSVLRDMQNSLRC